MKRPPEEGKEILHTKARDQTAGGAMSKRHGSHKDIKKKKNLQERTDANKTKLCIIILLCIIHTLILFLYAMNYPVMN